MSAEKRKAAALYEAFHEGPPTDGVMVNIPIPPKTVWQLGRVISIAYEARIEGELVSFEHEFKARSAPHLAVSSDGKSMFLAGGKFRVTERGITDI